MSGKVSLAAVGAGLQCFNQDQGLGGVVLHLGPDFGRIAVDGVHVRAGAAAPLAGGETAARHGLSGLEFTRNPRFLGVVSL